MMHDLPILTREDQFADYLSRDFTIPQIKVAMRLTHGQAQGLMARIRAKLGAQAV